MSKFLQWGLLLFGIVLVPLWLRFGIIPWSSFVPVAAQTESIYASFVLDSQPNKRQSDYDCGAYNLHWLLSALGIENKVTDVVAMNRKKMIPRVGVVPEVLVNTLRKYNISSKLRTFRWLNADKKEATLKALLQDHPVILLIKRHGYLHFILLTGFENNTVHLYDPLLNDRGDGDTNDNNGIVAGNDSMTFNQLIQLWDEVSVVGMYKNMAIIIEQ